MVFMAFLVGFLPAYLIGTIPFGLVLSKIAGYGDIRKIGSGNIGATNVLRTGNKFLAFLTLLFDGLKGALGAYCVLIFNMESGETIIPVFLLLISGLGAILGHCFPVWLKFKGGKGVSTALGVLLAAVPYAGLGAAVVWIGTLLVFRISSLSALVACAAAPIITLFIYGAMPAAIVLLISLLIAYRHKDNIKRLLKGEEPKVGKKNA